MKILAILEKRSKLFWAIIGVIFIAATGVIDYLTGYEIAFSLFYLFPVALLTWFAGGVVGIMASLVSALVWVSADIASGNTYSHPAIPYWNSLIRFSFFLIVTYLLAALKKAHEREKELARIDNLTGAVNGRFFSELLLREIDRSQRNKHPFTLAFFDLDNFKAVNDLYGHSIGDKVLCATVKQAISQLRKVDVVARLGGDEFAFLLPETDQAAAQVAIQRVHAGMLEEMRKNNWPVTFSIGVLTCIRMTQTSDELIRRADELMYSAKKNGKNSILYSVHAG